MLIPSINPRQHTKRSTKPTNKPPREQHSMSGEAPTLQERRDSKMMPKKAASRKQFSSPLASPKSPSSTASRAHHQPAESEIITQPGPHDVLMGRGAPATDYFGNLRFRELVKERRAEYVGCKRRKDKGRICGEVVDKVRSLGGRFLQKVESSSSSETGQQQHAGNTATVYETVEDRATLCLKVKQLMRDVGPAVQARKRGRQHHQHHREQPQPQQQQQQQQSPDVSTGRSFSEEMKSPGGESATAARDAGYRLAGNNSALTNPYAAEMASQSGRAGLPATTTLDTLSHFGRDQLLGGYGGILRHTTAGMVGEGPNASSIDQHSPFLRPYSLEQYNPRASAPSFEMMGQPPWQAPSSHQSPAFQFPPSSTLPLHVQIQSARERLLMRMQMEQQWQEQHRFHSTFAASSQAGPANLLPTASSPSSLSRASNAPPQVLNLPAQYPPTGFPNRESSSIDDIILQLTERRRREEEELSTSLTSSSTNAVPISSTLNLQSYPSTGFPQHYHHHHHHHRESSIDDIILQLAERRRRREEEEQSKSDR